MRPSESTPAPLPVIGFVGWSGCGKTTLITALMPQLMRRGLRVAVLKHAHHGFDIDRPGKDSYRVREAGAVQVLVASRDRWVLMAEEKDRGPAEPHFEELLGRFDPTQVDLVLAEGFSTAAYPKIEVYRADRGEPPKCWPDDPHLIALATDSPPPTPARLPVLDLNDPLAVAEFILRRLPGATTPSALSFNA
jgi:molybdopterin-guanine dinucleotide biosynthesis adapter protein